MLSRYNFIVKMAKTLLISLAVLFLFLIIFNNKRDSFITESKPSKSLTLSDSKINVAYPVFSSNGENSYRIFAESINKGSGETYFLDKISGIYNIQEQENITINAINCALNNQNDSAVLNNEVKIGYENYLMLTDKINVDFQKKSAENDDFVMVIGENAKITADRFKTNEEFCEVIFNGNVKAHFNLDDAKN